MTDREEIYRRWFQPFACAPAEAARRTGLPVATVAHRPEDPGEVFWHELGKENGQVRVIGVRHQAEPSHIVTVQLPAGLEGERAEQFRVSVSGLISAAYGSLFNHDAWAFDTYEIGPVHVWVIGPADALGGAAVALANPDGSSAALDPAARTRHRADPPAAGYLPYEMHVSPPNPHGLRPHPDALLYLVAQRTSYMSTKQLGHFYGPVIGQEEAREHALKVAHACYGIEPEQLELTVHVEPPLTGENTATISGPPGRWRGKAKDIPPDFRRRPVTRQEATGWPQQPS